MNEPGTICELKETGETWVRRPSTGSVPPKGGEEAPLYLGSLIVVTGEAGFGWGFFPLASSCWDEEL